MVRFLSTHRRIIGFILVLASLACRSQHSEYPVADLAARIVSAKRLPEDARAARATGDGRLICEPGSSLRYVLPRCIDPVLRLGFDPAVGKTSLSIRWEGGEDVTVFNSPESVDLELGPQMDTWNIEVRAGEKRVVLTEARVVDRIRGPVSSAYREGTAIPNIILIIIDTLRADHLGCYGAIEPITTALDSLALRGILYESATSQANGTLPSISSILSGVYPYNHGIYSNDLSLDEQWTTLPEVLKGAGYATGAFVGAFHLNPRISGYGSGFDVFGRCRRAERRAEEVVNEALEWLESHREDRFFAMVHMFDPHTPYRPPRAFRNNYYRGDPRDPDISTMDEAWFPKAKRAYIRSWLGGITDIEWPLAQYKSEVEYASTEAGRLFHWLDNADLTDQTIVIVTADHGESLTEHGIYFEHAGLYEESIQVPLIVSCPGVLPEGVRINTPVENFSIFPTLLRLLDIPHPDGLSAASLPLGQEDPPPGEIVSEAGFEQAIMVRRGDVKYILNTRPSFFTSYEEELYDLHDDPEEMTNIVETQPGKMRTIHETARTIAKKRERVKERKTSTLDAEDKARLRALGYVE